MSLSKKGTSFELDWESLEYKTRGSFKVMKDHMITDTESLYDTAVNLIRSELAKKVIPSESFLIFGMIFGHYALNKAEADLIWDEYCDILDYDVNGEIVITHIKKVLGTLLMIEIGKDDGAWEWYPDPDKKSKKSIDETPDAAIYNLRKKRG